MLSYFNLQEVVTTDALVVHLVVSIVSVATALILDECEAAGLVSMHGCRVLDQGILTVCLRRCEEPECHSGRDVRTFESCQYTSSIAGWAHRVGVGSAVWQDSEGMGLDWGVRSARRRGWDEGVNSIERVMVDWRMAGRCRWRLRGDVPFEFVCEVARASALAEAGHVEGCAAAARHGVSEVRVVVW